MIKRQELINAICEALDIPRRRKAKPYFTKKELKQLQFKVTRGDKKCKSKTKS